MQRAYQGEGGQHDTAEDEGDGEPCGFIATGFRRLARIRKRPPILSGQRSPVSVFGVLAHHRTSAPGLPDTFDAASFIGAVATEPQMDPALIVNQPPRSRADCVVRQLEAPPLAKLPGVGECRGAPPSIDCEPMSLSESLTPTLPVTRPKGGTFRGSAFAAAIAAPSPATRAIHIGVVLMRGLHLVPGSACSWK